jgi:hypothetical protein
VIQAIDMTSRAVTLKQGRQPHHDLLRSGDPAIRRTEGRRHRDVPVTRVDRLSIAAPGSTPPGGGTAIVRSSGDKPAGMIAKRESAVVTVLAIDHARPSVTIQNQDGSKASFKVENRRTLTASRSATRCRLLTRRHWQ